ncbi:MAG: DUF4097 family beta strand repeat-containing protein [Candidatus Aminicenantes bacterium]|nr:DUF4097 family beta strand repeat-containing protein [Candidatus Aminicenantes bacterium]
MSKRQAIRRAVVIGALLALAVYPLTAFAEEKIDQKFSKVEALAKDGKVIVGNISGTIEVKSWAEAQVKIEAVKTSKAKTMDKAKENLDKVQIVVQKTGEIVRIETKYPERQDRNESLNVSVSYQIWIPEKASLSVRNVSGTVDVQNIGGAFDGKVTSGNATLAKLGAGADFEVVSGTTKASDIVGDCNFRSVSGNVTVERVKGSVEAETTSGTLRLIGIEGARSVRAKVLSGNVTYDGKLEKDGRYSLEAMSGRVEMTLPGDSSFELSAESFSGGISTDFAVTMTGRISEGHGPVREMRGTVGNGGASVRLKTFSGSVSLKKK